LTKTARRQQTALFALMCQHPLPTGEKPVAQKEKSPMVVLLLESNPKPLQRALEKKGLRVEVAASVASADRAVRSTHPDVIVIEQDLLTGDGLALVRRWRNAGIKAHVLVLGTRGNLQNKLDAFSQGADDLVIKPYAIDELADRLSAVGQHTEPTDGAVVFVGALEINSSTRTVKRHGKRIDLTPREFDLLEYLAANRGKTVSRSMIRDHLYEGRVGGRSNVVDVYIRYLRKKIDTGFEPALILTCRGEGYMLRGSMEDAA
jgi:DNA-binding response OmpR family regulator